MKFGWKDFDIKPKEGKRKRNDYQSKVHRKATSVSFVNVKSKVEADFEKKTSVNETKRQKVEMVLSAT